MCVSSEVRSFKCVMMFMCLCNVFAARVPEEPVAPLVLAPLKFLEPWIPTRICFLALSLTTMPPNYAQPPGPPPYPPPVNPVVAPGPPPRTQSDLDWGGMRGPCPPRVLDNVGAAPGVPGSDGDADDDEDWKWTPTGSWTTLGLLLYSGHEVGAWLQWQYYGLLKRFLVEKWSILQSGLDDEAWGLWWQVMQVVELDKKGSHGPVPAGANRNCRQDSCE